MDKVETGKDLALFNVYMTAARKPRFKWVGPLQKETVYLYGLENTQVITDFDSAMLVPGICVVYGNNHHTLLRKRRFPNIRTAGTYTECFELLKEGKVQLTATSDTTLPYLLKIAGIEKERIHKVPPPLMQSNGFIAFSRNIPDTTIAKWQAAFDALVDSGRYQSLCDLYFANK